MACLRGSLVGSPGLNPTDPAQPTSCVGRHGRLTAADAMRPWRAGLPSGRSLGAASELGGSSLDLVLVGDREPAGARSDAGRARNAISDDQPTAVRTIASALQLGHGLRALWRRLDLPIAGARRVLRHGGDRRLGHPTATSSAMRNSVLVARARGRQARGRCQPTLLPSSRGEQEFRHALRGLSSSRSAAGPSLEPSKYPTSWAAARKKARCLVSKAVTRGQCQDGAGF